VSGGLKLQSFAIATFSSNVRQDTLCGQMNMTIIMGNFLLLHSLEVVFESRVIFRIVAYYYTTAAQ